MRRRIVALAMLAAAVATSLFGIPLALGAAHYFLANEAIELERTADTAAVDAAGDLARGRQPGDMRTPDRGTSTALYTATGQRIGGDGPPSADTVVRQTLGDNTVHHASGAGRLTVGVPIGNGPHPGYVVWASTSDGEVYPRIAATWLLMLALEAVNLALTWQLARWLARRLARPVETLAASAARLGEGDFTVRAQPSGIAEIDSAATALNQTAARIGDLVDRERAVTANASHQLRTPLAGLRLSLETALDANPVDHRQAMIDAIAAADRLQRTIDDLVALARDQVRGREALRLEALLTEIADIWQRRLAETGRALRITADPDLPPSPASTAAVRQILAVLIDNAVQHGTGEVTVHARDASGTAAIDVTDEGTDLHADESAIFDRHPASGHGIGLPLARSLADAEGGRLRLTTRTPTTPTTFTVFLPATATQPSAPEASS